MQRTNVLAALLVTLSLISMGCGTSDSVKSITLSPTGSNFQGVDTSFQLTVSANYNSGKVIDVTNESTYAITAVCCDVSGNALPVPAAPANGQPGTVWVDGTGVMTDEVLVWTWTLTSAPNATPLTYQLTGYYQVAATDGSMASQPVSVAVASEGGNGPGGACGPSTQ
ncbi:MAG: hypothetical protein WCA20_38235 [Candidatus Sulfotelmatobacter sp.]